MGDVEEEVPLEGGNITAGVVRVGDTVRRPQAPTAPTVHALLSHLEREGFEHAPRFLGIDDQGREILTYHPGVVAWPFAPDSFSTDETLARLAEIVAGYHRAVATFTIPEGAVFWPANNNPPGPIVLHGDLAPWNVVVGDEPRVLIDWDSIAPGPVEWEIAYVLHTFVSLWPHSELSDAETVRRLLVFADAYGLDHAGLRRSLDLVPARLDALARFTLARAAAGDPLWIRLHADGHADTWLDAAAHVATRLATWQRAL